MSELRYEIKFLQDDEGFYITLPSTVYPCGYQILRGPFQNKPLAEKALDFYIRKGEWPGKKPVDTEQDV